MSLISLLIGKKDVCLRYFIKNLLTVVKFLKFSKTYFTMFEISQSLCVFCWFFLLAVNNGFWYFYYSCFFFDSIDFIIKFAHVYHAAQCKLIYFQYFCWKLFSKCICDLENTNIFRQNYFYYKKLHVRVRTKLNVVA